MKDQIIGRSQANQPVRNKELAKILEHVAVADDGTVQVGKDLEVDGAVKIETEPTADNEAANKKYVDSKAGKKLYRHRIYLTATADDGAAAVSFALDVYDHDSAPHATKDPATYGNDNIFMIGHLPAVGQIDNEPIVDIKGSLTKLELITASTAAYTITYERRMLAVSDVVVEL